MKILKLHFKNINSLQGESALDFNQGPLANAGVFAITGPNGSGKSSLLDAITLALYGETFKFDRPSAHVMTRHATDCFAEIEFQVHGTQYRSRWQAIREQENEQAGILPAVMQLVKIEDETETVLATDVAKVRASIADIIGLDFRSFTRSTLLAQGDFAAFLNALDSERLDILERIISTDIYAEYQQDVIKKEAQERIALEKLQADLAAIPLLSAATQQTYEQDLADFQAQLADFEQALHTLSQQAEGLQQLAEFDAAHQQAQAQQQSLQTQWQQLMTDLERLEVSRAAQGLQQEVQTISDLQSTLATEQESLAQYQEELGLLQTQLRLSGEQLPNPALVVGKSVHEQQELIADLTFQTEQLQTEQGAEQTAIRALDSKLENSQTSLATVKSWLTEHAQEALLLNDFPDLGQLRKLNRQINELQQQQKSTSKVAKESVSKHKNQQSTLQGLLKEVPENQKKLTAYEAELKDLLKGHQPEDLENLRLEQQARVKDFKELLNLSKIQKRFKPSWLVRWGLVKPPKEPNTTAINQRVHDLNMQLLTEENIKKALEQAVFNESLLKKLQADRIHLIHNEPCPLCGASNHPYVSKPPALIDSKQALDDQTKRIQTLNASIEKWQQQLKKAQKQIDLKQLRADRLTRIESEWAALCNRLNIASPNLRIDHPAPIKAMLQKQLQELGDIERLLKAVQQVQKKIVELAAQLEVQNNSVNRLQGIMQTPVEAKDIARNDIDILNQTLARDIAEEKQLSEKVMAQLAQLGEKMPSKDKKVDALIDRLNQRRQTYQTYLLQEKALLEEIAALRQDLAACQTNLATHTQRLQDSTAKLLREQGSGLHLAIIEKQHLINEKTTHIAQLTAQIQIQQQAAQAQAQQWGIQDYADLVNVLQLLPQHTVLLEQQHALETQLSQATLNEQTIIEHQQAIQALVPLGQSLEACTAEQQNLLEKCEISQLEIARLEDLLEKQAYCQEKVDATLARIIEQKARYEQAQVDLQQLQAEQGHAFRRKVQRSAADKLLSKTNQILEKISGRFYIRQGQNDQGLALEVEDTFQENTRRLPKTLSGGESFVVSLAMALGLSELASNGQAIESLFLDEGFGNLDAETLYTVVSTLEVLQTQGKKVGVISHVEGVRKRIKTQIEMRKKPNGLSEFNVLT